MMVNRSLGVLSLDVMILLFSVALGSIVLQVKVSVGANSKRRILFGNSSGRLNSELAASLLGSHGKLFLDNKVFSVHFIIGVLLILDLGNTGLSLEELL